jgi:hypothetical protein
MFRILDPPILRDFQILDRRAGLFELKGDRLALLEETVRQSQKMRDPAGREYPGIGESLV